MTRVWEETNVTKQCPVNTRMSCSTQLPLVLVGLLEKMVFALPLQRGNKRVVVNLSKFWLVSLLLRRGYEYSPTMSQNLTVGPLCIGKGSRSFYLS